MDSIVHPGTAPFWIALLTVAGLGIVELVSVLLGASASGTDRGRPRLQRAG
jgi:hypothetical protein